MCKRVSFSSAEGGRKTLPPKFACVLSGPLIMTTG